MNATYALLVVMLFSEIYEAGTVKLTRKLKKMKASSDQETEKTNITANSPPLKKEATRRRQYTQRMSDGNDSGDDGFQTTFDFEVKNFAIPPPMAYTDLKEEIFKLSALSSHESDATEMFRAYIQSVMENAAEEELLYAGYGKMLNKMLSRMTIESQYEPLKCARLFTVSPTNYDTSFGYGTGEGANPACIASQGHIVAMCNCDSRSSCQLRNGYRVAKIEKKYLSYPFTVKISHGAFLKWFRHHWRRVQRKAEAKLRNGVYHDYFALATIE